MAPRGQQRPGDRTQRPRRKVDKIPATKSSVGAWRIPLRPDHLRVGHLHRGRVVADVGRAVISKTERAELRTLIRHRFKVLRGEVEQRERELLAELEQKITVAYADEDKLWADLGFTIDQHVLEANRKANDSIRAAIGQEAWPEELRLISATDVRNMRARAMRVGLPAAGQVRREGTTRIESTVRAAFLTLARQEVDLLTRLATGALESDEARAFLGEIPTVSALVPAERLLELERSLGDGGVA